MTALSVGCYQPFKKYHQQKKIIHFLNLVLKVKYICVVKTNLLFILYGNLVLYQWLMSNIIVFFIIMHNTQQ